ncbi:unnamed protein product [Ectocarpus sp. CCAP 1310/34]|nr:unnamed protein product [Ectocarpus sp. CCAP 1310/34]
MLRCNDEQWAQLHKSTEMFDLMADWEAKKTDHHPGKKVWISIAGVLDHVGMSAKDYEGARKQFNDISMVSLKLRGAARVPNSAVCACTTLLRFAWLRKLHDTALPPTLTRPRAIVLERILTWTCSPRAGEDSKITYSSWGHFVVNAADLDTLDRAACPTDYLVTSSLNNPKCVAVKPGHKPNVALLL